jgi:hypothetical protein
MRYAMLLLLGLWMSTLTGQEAIENFRINYDLNPHVGPDDMVVRSIEDNVIAEQWPEAKQLAYAQYPLAVGMPSASIPMTAAEAYALLKAQAQPIAIGHRWVKSKREIWLADGRRIPAPPTLRRIILWLEPRPKYLNDDEINEGTNRGDFESLFPPYPIGVFAPANGFRLGARYVNFPIPSISSLLTLNGVPPRGELDELYPIEASVELYSAWSFPTEELIAQEIDMEMENLGSGRVIPKWDEVLHTPSGVVLKGLGTQFGHIGYRWVSGGNLFKLAIMGKERTVLDAFLKQNPSELPKDFSLDLQAAGMVILRRGLARLRAAPPVLEDDRHMIRIRPLENRDQFQRGINLLKALKDLWPVVYGYDKARRARYDQHLSPESHVFSWQAYIDEETAARAEVIAAVAAFAEQAERRGLLRQEKVPRHPWAEWASDALPPCYVLGPER